MTSEKNNQVKVCAFCGKSEEMDLLKECRYENCNKLHYSKHILPEEHNCVGLEDWKKRYRETWNRKLTKKNNTKSISFENVGSHWDNQYKNSNSKKSKEIFKPTNIEQTQFDKEEIPEIKQEYKKTKWKCFFGFHQWEKLGGAINISGGRFKQKYHCKTCGKVKSLIG